MEHKGLKLTAITLILALLSITVIGSGWISYEVQGAEPDPYDLKAAPHFRDVTYITEEPTYLQRFDGLGKWKVSFGSPTVAVQGSTLALAAPTTAKVELTLAETDAPGINTLVTSYMEAKIMASNIASQYTNLTLENVNTGNFAKISFHSADILYSYSTNSSIITGTLYGDPVANTYYRVSIELTTTSATFYVHSANGTLLANHYANNAVLGAGEVEEIKLAVTGNAGSAIMDYIYVTDHTPMSTDSSEDLELNVLETDAKRVQSSVQVDLSTLDVARSGSKVVNSANGFDPIDLTKQFMTRADLINMFGAMPEPNQRVEGLMVAKGWNDFRGDMESSLKGSISKSLAVTPDQVFLVDYYVDYLQLSTTFDQEIVNTQKAHLWESLQKAASAAGVSIDTSKARADTTQLSILGTNYISGSTMTVTLIPDVQMDVAADLWNSVGWGLSPGVKSVETMVRWVSEQNFGSLFEDPLGIKAMAEKFPSWRDLQDGLNQTYNQIADRFEAETARWWAVLNATTEKFIGLVGSSMTAAYTWATGTVNNITSSVNDQLTSIANMNQQFMSWSQTQMDNTNAMFAQMFTEMSDSLMETQRFFVNQQAKANEAITNITDDLANSNELVNNMWADAMDGGKFAEDTPLTLSAFFGSDLVQNMTIIVVIIVIIVIIALVLITMSGRKKAGRKRR